MTPPIRPGPAAPAIAVEIIERELGVFERPRDQPVEHIDMGAGRDLRHDAAEGFMLGDLAHHLIGENVAAARRPERDNGRRRLVTGGFNTQHAHQSRSASLDFCRSACPRAA